MTKTKNTVGAKIKRGITLLSLFLFFYFSLIPAFAATPTVGIISPSSGASLPNQTITFTTTYTDTDGWQNLQYLLFLFYSLDSQFHSLYLYEQNNHKLYLLNDTYTAWLGGFSPGQDQVIENSFSKLDCLNTSVSSLQSTLTINWRLTFKPTFTGKKLLFLAAIDDTGGFQNWTAKATWTVTHLLSLSVNPKEWNIGNASVNEVITMNHANKITVVNDGTGPETLELRLINPLNWIASTTAGEEKYVLSGLFCNSTDVPQVNNFNQDNSVEDVITTQSVKSTNTVFGYSQATANGVAVSAGGSRSLYLQFKSPTMTQKTDEQNISVIISCQVP